MVINKHKKGNKIKNNVMIVAISRTKIFTSKVKIPTIAKRKIVMIVAVFEEYLGGTKLMSYQLAIFGY